MTGANLAIQGLRVSESGAKAWAMAEDFRFRDWATDRATLIAEVNRLESRVKQAEDSMTLEQSKAECERDTALARVAELEVAWLPVGERLPAHARDVLVAYLGLIRVGSYVAGSGMWIAGEHYGTTEEIGITHWRELPPAPEK